MRVLIPGIAGKIGQIVARELLDAGHTVVGMDTRPWPNAPSAIEVVDVDLRKRAAEDVFRRVRPEAVVHMATVTHLLKSSDDRYRINLGGTRAVFDHAKAYGTEHVIFVGRHTYYGAAADAPLYHNEEEPPMALASFPELADLVAADLYAGSALWRRKEFKTTVLRLCYTLGPSGHGTLATFLRGPRVPTVLGYDPLFQFMHERDIARAIARTVEKRPVGVFNVAGPQPMPLSSIIKATGRKQLPMPEIMFGGILGRVGLPKLPPGALDHIKYPITIDAKPFRDATGFVYDTDEMSTLWDYKEAFPIASSR
jgi:UDP-glucose 4-epimerase